MIAVPLAWLNDALLEYDVGHALIVAFVLTLPAAFFKTRSTKVVALLLALFGAIFALAPIQAAATHWRFLGYFLLLIAPMAYVLARD